MTDGNILIVDDNEEILVALEMFLGEHFSGVSTAKDPRTALKLLGHKEYDVYILDMNFTAGESSGNAGIGLMRSIKKSDLSAIIVFITAYGDLELAVKAMKEGATDFIQKPWDDQKLLATIRAAMEISHSRKKIGLLREKQHQLQLDSQRDHRMVRGESPVMQRVLNTVEKVAPTDASVIILGENGTGKELIAREIHMRSKRRKEVYVRVDLGSLTESLFESEMFGHVKGAFTDAQVDKPGRFELASDGSIFLDEIANISPALQAKLLNVLETGEVTRLGSNIPRAVNVRIISATNRDLDQMVSEGTFRVDLLYRLDTIRIELPPLREHAEDIPALVDFFLERLDQKYGRKVGISKNALNKLAVHTWPGNVRELQYTLEKAVILAESEVLSERDFLLNIRPQEGIKTVDLKQNERDIIIKAIRMNAGNLSRAARHLGISRMTLYNKIRKYEI